MRWSRPDTRWRLRDGLLATAFLALALAAWRELFDPMRAWENRVSGSSRPLHERVIAASSGLGGYVSGVEVAQALSKMLGALKSGRLADRQTAAFALSGSLGYRYIAEPAVDHLIAVLRDPEPSIREHVLLGLGQAANTSDRFSDLASAALTSAASDPAYPSRPMAVAGLGYLGGCSARNRKAAVATLTKISRDVDPAIRHAALSSLYVVADGAATTRVYFVDDFGGHYRVDPALGEIVIARALEMRSDPDRYTRAVALSYLVHLERHDDALPGLAALLAEKPRGFGPPSQEWIEAGVAAIVSLDMLPAGTPGVAGLLIAASRRTFPAYRHAALRALCRPKLAVDVEIWEALYAATFDPEPAVREIGRTGLVALRRRAIERRSAVAEGRVAAAGR